MLYGFSGQRSFWNVWVIFAYSPGCWWALSCTLVTGAATPALPVACQFLQMHHATLQTIFRWVWHPLSTPYSGEHDFPSADLIQVSMASLQQTIFRRVWHPLSRSYSGEYGIPSADHIQVNMTSPQQTIFRWVRHLLRGIYCSIPIRMRMTQSQILYATSTLPRTEGLVIAKTRVMDGFIFDQSGRIFLSSGSHWSVRVRRCLIDWFTGWAEKKWAKLLLIILVVWQLSTGFCLTHPMLCDCYIDEKGLLLIGISKWLRRETINWKFLHFFVRDTKSQILSVSHNRLLDQEAYRRWRRRQLTCRQWSRDCCGLWQLARCFRNSPSIG